MARRCQATKAGTEVEGQEAMKGLLITCVMVLALLVPNIGMMQSAVANSRTPDCVTKTEWKNLDTNDYIGAVAKHFGTNGVLVPERTHEGRVTRKYPVCGYASMDPKNPIDCKSGYALIVWDTHHRYVLFGLYEVNHDNYTCPEGDHYGVL
jgi:hypothetical protein